MEDFELLKSLIQPGETWSNPDFVCLDYIDVCFQHKYQKQIVFVTGLVAFLLLLCLLALLKLAQLYSSPALGTVPTEPSKVLSGQSPFALQIPQDISALKLLVDGLSQEQPDLKQQMKVLRSTNSQIVSQIQDTRRRAEEISQNLQRAEAPQQDDPTITPQQTPRKSLSRSVGASSTPSKAPSTKQMRSKKRQLKEHDLINQYNKAS